MFEAIFDDPDFEYLLSKLKQFPHAEKMVF